MAALKGNTRKIADLFWAGKENGIRRARRKPARLRFWTKRGLAGGDGRQRIKRRSCLECKKGRIFAKKCSSFELLWRSGVEIEVVATESANRANTALENLDVMVRKFHERIKTIFLQ